MIPGAAIQAAITEWETGDTDDLVEAIRDCLEAAAPFLLDSLEAELSALKKAVTDEVERLREIQAQSGVAEATADRLEQALQASTEERVA